VVRRVSTTTPNQALYLMNSPFLHGEARAAAEATAGVEGVPKRVAALYERILQRGPTDLEASRAREFLQGERGSSSQSAGAWNYGHGRWHRDSRRVEFRPLPHFTGNSWQGGSKLPDPKTGWVHWTAEGGHPGHGDHAAILRWVAPRDARIMVAGELVRPQEQGDGIRAFVLKAGEMLAQWDVGPQGRSRTDIPAIEVKAGAVIDFLVESTGDEGWDGFRWAPVIGEVGQDLPLAEASAGFAGPALDRWPLLAQVLLLSNEFLFVD
jgi:hypothetical protein